ncbi:MAG: nucleotidyltransferase family protein [Chloroflexi bacterium]|nr:nucleotidyltransferase family protein [Chloroflexota bacterium]
MLKHPIKELFISPTAPIRFAIENIDRGGMGITLVVNDEQHLAGTISDGDVRRAMLDGVDLNQPVRILLERKANTQYSKPITAQVGTAPDTLIALMREYALTVIPILSEDNRVIDLITMEELIPSDTLPLQAVIMAGGFGSRLQPFTAQTPKPMLPVGGRPVMEVILEKLRLAGIQKINVTTHYLPEKITEHFGDGKDFGVELSYVNEEEPLGTGGALGLLPQPTGPILVVNGDVLTQVNYRAMLAFHKENLADMTVAVRQYEFEIPYGVVECDGVRIKALREKPRIEHFINAGIYLLSPSVYDYIPSGKHFNMTDLIQWLIDAGRIVVSFPVNEYWLDVGQPKDYARAQQDVENGLMANKDEGSHEAK